MNKRSVFKTISRSNQTSRHFLYILSGLPAIGKSQRSDWWQRQNGWSWIEFDRIRHSYTGAFDNHALDTSHVYPKILLDVEAAVEVQAKYIVLDGRNANYDTIGYLSCECRDIFARYEHLQGRYEIHWCLFENNLEQALRNQEQRWDRHVSEQLIRDTHKDLKKIDHTKLKREKLIDMAFTMEAYRSNMPMRGF